MSRQLRAGEGGGQGAPGVDEFGRPAFDGCPADCGECRRQREAQRAEDIAVYGLIVACACGMFAGVISALAKAVL